MTTVPLLICLAWLASIAAVVVLAIRAQGNFYPHPAYVGLLGIMGAHVSLASLAVGLLRGAKLWYVALLLVTIAGWYWFWHKYVSAAVSGDVARVCLAQAVMVVLVSRFGRLAWCTVTGAERQGDPVVSAFVASRGVRLWHLFAIITFIAVAVALVGRLSTAKPPRDADLLWLIANNTTACLGSAWIVLASRRPLAGVVILCLALTALSIYGGTTLGGSGAGPLLAINGLQTTLVLAALLSMKEFTAR